jgi:hypothetical protein
MTESDKPASPPKQAAEGEWYITFWPAEDGLGEVSLIVGPHCSNAHVVEKSAFQKVVEERDKVADEAARHWESFTKAEEERDEARAALSHAVTMAKEAQAREDEARAECERLRTAISTFFTSHKGLEGMSDAYKGLRASLEGSKP